MTPVSPAQRLLMEAAPRSPGRLSRQTVELLVAYNLEQNWGASPDKLYTRDDVDADLAEQLWQHCAVFAHRPEGSREPLPEWVARRILRPESAPQDLTTKDILAWSAEVAEKVAHLARFELRHPAPANVLAGLLARPEPHIRAMAAVSPGMDEELAGGFVLELGELATQVWPGLEGFDGDRGAQSPEALLSRAVHIVGQGPVPQLIALAARRWTSPAALGQLNVRHLPKDAAERVVFKWLLPAFAANAANAAALLCDTLDALPAIGPELRQKLLLLWRDPARIEALVGDEDERKEAVKALDQAFANVGLSLTPPLLDRPVDNLGTVSHWERPELVAAVEAHSPAGAPLLPVLLAFLDSGATFDGTWSQLFDTLLASVTAEDPTDRS